MVLSEKDKCDIMEDAMRQIGWSPGAEIPMASEENLKLIEELRDLIVKRTEVKDELEDTNDVLEKLNRHVRNAEESIKSNLELLDAHQSEWRSEAHLFKVAERCTSKLNQEIKDYEKQIKQWEQHIAKTEKELCKRRKSVDNRTNRIKWAKTALQEWNEAIKEGERGFELLQKYAKDDEIRLRAQDKKRQTLLVEIAQLRADLINLYDEQKSLEQNLERTATMYRQAHLERRQLVETWQQAVTQMTQREQDIVDSETLLDDLKRETAEKSRIEKQQEDKLNALIENNRQVEEAISELNVENSDIKTQLQTIQDSISLKSNEIEGLQKELQNLTNRVHQQRAENRQLNKEHDEKVEELEKFDEVLKQLEERKANMENLNMNAEQRLKILEDLIENEEKSKTTIEKEIQRANGMLFKAQQKLVEFKDECKLLSMDNDGVKVTTQAVERKTMEAEKELRRLTEVHYNLAFKCLEAERKIIKMTGGVIDPEQEERNMEYLAQLEEYNATITKRLNTTEAQNKKLDDNMRALTTSYNTDSKTLETLQFDIKEAQVYCEGGMKRLKSETKTNQELIVELSILKLRVKEFENEIVKCDNSTYTLEQHRANLQRTVKDRITEVKSQLDLLAQKRKHLQEERSQLLADLAERNTKLEALRARFELNQKLLGVNEDGTPVTATQLRVETAQEKQLLLEEGNELNERVMKAEREVKALENTLKMFTCANDNYRKSLQSKEDVEAAEELKILNENLCKTVCKLKELRAKYMEIESEIQKLQEQKEALSNEIKELLKKLGESTEDRDKLKRELASQAEKMDRADRELKRLMKAVRQSGKYNEEQLALIERDLDIREIEKRNMDTLNKLSDFAESDKTIGPIIVERMLKHGLKLPRSMKARSKTSLRGSSSGLSAAGCSARSTTSLNSTTSCSQPSLSCVSVLSLEFPDNNKKK